MRFEIPELGRCCFCFPLRLGLIVWGYLKLIASSIQFGLMLTSLIFEWHRYWREGDVTTTIFYLILLASLAADIVFHVIFAIGAHKKDAKKVELFSKFCIYILVLYMIGTCLAVAYTICSDHFFEFFFGLTFIIAAVLGTIIQIYITILVRSEAMKLKRGSNFQFINHGADLDKNVKLELGNTIVQ